MCGQRSRPTSTSPQTEETHENYDPQKTAVRSEQTSSDSRKGGDGAEGIPGALSNQPPGTSGAPVIPGAAATPGSPENGQSAAASSGPSSNSSRSTRNYEVDRTLSYVKQPTGMLKRLSVGVVFDDWQKVGADGKADGVSDERSGSEALHRTRARSRSGSRTTAATRST